MAILQVIKWIVLYYLLAFTFCYPYRIVPFKPLLTRKHDLFSVIFVSFLWRDCSACSWFLRRIVEPVTDDEGANIGTIYLHTVLGWTFIVVRTKACLQF